MLRSTREILGYILTATDDEVGRCDEFLFDDTTWNIRYAVIDTRAFLPGKSVLVPLASLDSVRWHDRILGIGLTQEQIKNCPSYDPAAPVNTQLEERVYDYLGRPR